MRLLGCLLPLLLPSVFAFQFTTNPATPSSCEKFTVSWSGGSGPFTLQLIPVFGVPRNITIPGNAQGSFSVDQLPLAADQEYVLTMSDSTGFGSGGATTVLKAAKSSSSCDTTSPSVAFSFQLTSDLQQCKPYSFAAFDNAVQPVQIMGIIPGGQVTTLSPTNGAKNFDWTANVAEGTQMLFLMIDGQSRQGGSSKLQTVGGSGDKTCLNNALSSTPAAAPSTAAPTATKGGGDSKAHTTGTANPSSSATAGPASGSSSTPVGAVVGGVLGALIGVGVVGALIMFLLRRRRAKSQWVGTTPLSDSPFPSMFGGYQSSASLARQNTYGSQSMYREPAANPFSDPPVSPPMSSRYPPTSPSRVPVPSYQPEPADPVSPFNGPAPLTPMPPAAPASQYNPPTTPPSAPRVSPFDPPAHVQGPRPPLRAPSSSTSSAVSSQRKALEAASSHTAAPSRYVLHTDADEFDELPPQYQDRRISAVSHAESRTSLAYAQDTYTD